MKSVDFKNRQFGTITSHCYDFGKSLKGIVGKKILHSRTSIIAHVVKILGHQIITGKSMMSQSASYDEIFFHRYNF